ncbi:hypothetical protein [Flavobacterium sp.]|uniref:hypothetical protein n=1 Tax=Flavobacterium sp. TaxID=239 RepID=UPI003750F79E
MEQRRRARHQTRKLFTTFKANLWLSEQIKTIAILYITIAIFLLCVLYRYKSMFSEEYNLIGTGFCYYANQFLKLVFCL